MSLGMVSHAGSLLFPVNGDDIRIQIEDQRGPCRGQGKQIGSQAVVEPNQLANRLGREAFQESSQSRLIGETRKSQHLQEGSVVLQDFGLVDAAQSHHDGIDQSQNQFGRMVILVSLIEPNIFLQEFFESGLLHPTEVSNMGFVEGKTDFWGTFWHNAQNALLGSFVRGIYFYGYYTCLPS